MTKSGTVSGATSSSAQIRRPGRRVRSTNQAPADADHAGGGRRHRGQEHGVEEQARRRRGADRVADRREPALEGLQRSSPRPEARRGSRRAHRPPAARGGPRRPGRSASVVSRFARSGRHSPLPSKIPDRTRRSCAQRCHKRHVRRTLQPAQRWRGSCTENVEPAFGREWTVISPPICSTSPREM